MIMRKYLVAAACVLGSFAGRAQDINFSQFYELPLLRNPALAGSFKGDVRVTTAFRNQWASVTTPYKTLGLGAELRLAAGAGSNNYFSTGMQVTHDIAGDSRLTRTQALPMFAFHKSLSEDRDAYLTVGVVGGYVQQRFDPARLKFSDQFVAGAYSAANPTRERFSDDSRNYGDLTIGASFSTETATGTQYFIGGAVFHVSEPRVAFSADNDIRLNRKYVLNGGVNLFFNEDHRVLLYADVFVQGGHRQGQGGALWQMYLGPQDDDLPVCLYAGALYRWNDAFVPVVKLDYHQWCFGLSYDMNHSKLFSASTLRGGFELTLSYRNFLNSGLSSLSATRCPKTF
ncbi:MAG: type IX secretion system membrane protein PorP/SprF [Chitinophagaceae bacterium]|nr:MAG: type IX secretion system membrane protein PorP/SprF [Chitinophagaceae bacterium]